MGKRTQALIAPAPLDRQMGDRAPTAKFSDFPFDVIARYVNHKVEFTVEHDPYTPVDPTEVATPWIVRKLT